MRQPQLVVGALLGAALAMVGCGRASGGSAGTAAAPVRFVDVTAAAGAALSQPRTGRGLAVADYDLDGDLDLLVTANRGRAVLLENEGRPRGHWLGVKLIGTRSNREGIGARIRVTAGGRTRTGWVRSGGSFCSEDERVARFGLGELTRAERVEVRWPGGSVDRRDGVPANQVLILREGPAP